MTSAGYDAIAMPTDIGDFGEVQRLADAAVEAFGGVDVAFLNAGLAPPKIETACELGFGQGVSVNDVLGEYVARKPATLLDLARAKRRLRQCAFIGFGETLDTSLVGLGRLLDWPDIERSVAPETLRDFGTRTPVDAADRAIIREINALDTALYDFARALRHPARAGRPPHWLAGLFGRAGREHALQRWADARDISVK